MWPFTSRRIFANRWWALGFVAFVCWQVADIFEQPVPEGGNVAALAGPGDEPLDAAQVQTITDNLNNIQAAE